jgi:hypothetical protein
MLETVRTGMSTPCVPKAELRRRQR